MKSNQSLTVLLADFLYDLRPGTAEWRTKNHEDSRPRLPSARMRRENVLLAICLVVLCGILMAGLWPFHAPKNEVGWLSEGNGLLFGKHGTIVSASPFNTRASQDDNSCSLEIWLEPIRVDSKGTILSFYWPARRIASFAARQWQGALVLERESQNHSAKKAGIYVGDVFKRLKPVFVTITSGEAGAATYVDGTLVERFPTFAFSSLDLSGQLIVGSAPATAWSWSGQFKGLAVYDRELTAAEVSQHYANWTENRQADSDKRGGVVGLYLFNEGSGNVIHSQVATATDLLIPEHFLVFHKEFLKPFWKEFRPGWSYWKDVGINVAGFVPLGFFFCSYFSLVRWIEYPALVTIAVGFFVSLAIEILQAYLPTRDSGTTDLITNTFGTALGVFLYGWAMRCNCLTQVGISIDSAQKREKVFN